MNDHLTPEEQIQKSLVSVAKGGTLILAGMFVSQLLGFVRQFTVVRFLSPEDFGYISLGMILTDIFILLATVGLNVGSQRYIAFYKGRGDMDRVRGVIISTAKILVASVTMVTAAVLLLASPLASLFEMEEMTMVIRYFAMLIPLYVFIDIVTSFFLGFERAGPKAIFQRMLLSVACLGFVVAFLLIKRDLYSVVLAMVLAYTLVAGAASFYIVKRFPVRMRGEGRVSSTFSLIKFSLPLFASTALSYLVYQIDTLMLGYYMTADMVGIYNGAFIFSVFLASFLHAIGVIYMPVASTFVARGQHAELQVVYRSATKWLFLATLPLFLILFMFPRTVLDMILGGRYSEAAVALQLLCVGEFVSTLVGPTAMTLVAYGRANLLMLKSAIALAADVILNILLIPRFGITGAALASCIALALANIVETLLIYFIYGIHPFGWNYIKPILILTSLSIALYVPMKSLLAVSSWFLVAYYPLLLGLGIAATVISRSLEPSDRYFIDAVLRKLKSIRSAGA